jgi:hypothetical protein
MQTTLRKFDPSSITNTNIILILGRRSTGKSFLVRDLLKYLHDIPQGTVINPTESAVPFYTETVPSLDIHHGYSPKIVESVVKNQKIRVKQGREGADDLRTSLILDNCLYDGTWKTDVNIRYIFMNGRSIKLNLLIAMSTGILGMQSELRTNLDYVFIFHETNDGSRRRIFENFARIFSTFETFCETLDQVTSTEKYNCLVINNTIPSNKLEDSVFWYVAPLERVEEACVRNDVDTSIE